MNFKLEQKKWHSIAHEEVLKELQSSREGLSAKEAEDRRKRFGENVISQRNKDSAWKILFRQLHNPLIYILIACASLAIIMGKITDACVVAAVIVINTIIGFIQEYQAGNTINALLKLVPEKVQVRRDGSKKSLPGTTLVPGDYVFLQAGDKVPADIRLCYVKNVKSDEAILTGESVPADKTIEAASPDASIGDRSSMLFSGTLLSSGTAEGVVAATGTDTELGKISNLLESTKSVKSPLSKSLDKIASTITYVVIGIGLVVFAIGFLRGYEINDAILSALTLAVATVPEGLPAVITVASAIGISRMAKRKAVIRRLPSVETLGSTTVICSDKTGTLTRNEMVVQHIRNRSSSFTVSGEGLSPGGNIEEEGGGAAPDPQELDELIEACALCNDAGLKEENGQWKGVGDPTEVAMITLVRKAGMLEDELRGQHKRLDEVPFDSATKIMATLNHYDDEARIYVKGAPEVVIPLLRPEEGSKELEDAALDLAARGMRVLAFARKTMPADTTAIQEENLKELDFLGLLAMSDPPREEVRSAIKTCHEAGIVVKMITGDHPATASAIGKELGLQAEGDAVTGKELEKLGKDQLRELVQKSNIFARVSPEDKLRLVEALQEHQEVVAMTGDGVNDAPALKRADIGVAMGITGTSAAKEAADMILTNDNFESIEAAVEEGRRVFDNLLKCIAFVLPTSIGLGLIIFVAVIFFPSGSDSVLQPMQPVQVLWINLITAVALTVPLAFEAMEPDIMRRKPRETGKPILSGFILFRIVLVSLIMAGGTIALFLWKYHQESGSSGDIIAKAQTMAVTSMVLFQVFYLFNCRSLTHSAARLGLFSNLYIYFGAAAVLLAQAGFVYLPFMHDWFHVAPLSLSDWCLCALVAFSILVIIAAEKWVRQFLKKRKS